jgi:hypothetical protein
MARLAFAVALVSISGALIAASLLVVPQLATDALQEQQGRVIAFRHTARYDGMTSGPVRLADLKPNEAVLVLSPFSRDADQYHEQNIDRAAPDKVKEFIRKSEVYSHYHLVRLPEWLGGERDDISSLRAYSAVAVSNSCHSAYWGQPGRWVIEEPCHGDRFRPWDGLAIEGPAAMGISANSLVERPEPVALATLELAIDSEGYVVAMRPSSAENGVVGQGRKIDPAASNAEMLRAVALAAGYQPPFPASLGDKELAAVEPAEIPRNLKAAGRPTPLKATYFDMDRGLQHEGRVEVSAYPVDQFPALGSQPIDRALAPAVINQALPEGTSVPHYSTADYGGSAVIAGKSADGRELVVAIIVMGQTSEQELEGIAKSLGLD